MKNRSEIAKGLRIWGEGIVYEYKGKREFFYGKEQFCIFDCDDGYINIYL